MVFIAFTYFFILVPKGTFSQLLTSYMWLFQAQHTAVNPT